MEKRNLIISIALTIVIIVSFQFLTPKPKPEAPSAQTSSSTASGSTTATPGGTAAPELGSAAVAETREAALAASTRIVIDTPRVKGSIALKGARLDDLALADYHETIDPKSPDIVLLSPSGAPHAYVSEQGWIAKTPNVALPDQNTVWKAPDGARLTPKTPVTLTWDNGAGLHFARTISVDDNYVFTVSDTVANDGGVPVVVSPYALISRAGPIPESGTFISYEGPIGGFTDGAQDVKYSSLEADKPVERATTGGWVGFTDKYWLTAIAPKDQKEATTARFSVSDAQQPQKYQVDWLGSDRTIAPKASATSATYVFAGAKEVKLINAYTDNLHLPNFDVAVDWGWFWFLTKPIFFLLDYINSVVGNFGIAILLLTVLVKIVFFPLANKSYVNIHRMKRLQPEMQKLREKYGDDRAPHPAGDDGAL